MRSANLQGQVNRFRDPNFYSGASLRLDWHCRGNGTFLLSKIENGQAKLIKDVPFEEARSIVVLPGKSLQLKTLVMTDADLNVLPAGEYQLEFNLNEQDTGKALTQLTTFTWNPVRTRVEAQLTPVNTKRP